jgi:hypothetical protein
MSNTTKIHYSLAQDADSEFILSADQSIGPLTGQPMQAAFIDDARAIYLFLVKILPSGTYRELMALLQSDCKLP